MCNCKHKENREKGIKGILPIGNRYTLPKRGRVGDADYDLFLNLDELEEGDVIILPGDTKPLGVGFKMILERGYAFIIECRSGKGVKESVRIAAQTIDSNYLGEVKVAVSNANTKKTIVITKFVEHWRQLDKNGAFIIIDAEKAIAQGYIRKVVNHEEETPTILTQEEFEDLAKERTQRGDSWAGSSDNL